MTTKPYVAGSAYIDRMSDYCGPCSFNPKVDCPIRRLYWAFLDRHAKTLAQNPRLAVPLASLRKRKTEDKQQDREVFDSTLLALLNGERLDATAKTKESL